MLGRKLLQDKILRVIKSSGITGLKHYIQENDVSQIKKIIYSFKGNGNCDILIKAIESNVSSDIIEYIIIKGKYKTLNYVYQEGPCSPSHTPLTLAFLINRIDIANLLIKYGADINQCIRLLSVEAVDQLLNCHCSRYLIDKGMIRLTPVFINSLIENKNRIHFLKKLFKNVIFDTKFILKLLSFFKSRTKLSEEELCRIIQIEKNKIPINKEMYGIALENNNIDAFNFLYQQDIRKKEIILQEIYDLVHKSRLNNGLLLINHIKTKQLNIPVVDESFIVKLEKAITNPQERVKKLTMKERVNKIIQLIQNHSTVELEDFFEKERCTIEFSKSLYEIALENENDHTNEMINILYRYDNRSPDTLLKDLFQVFDRYERCHPSGKKFNFINNIENGKVVVQADGYYLNNLYRSEEKREKILEAITQNNMVELKQYLEKEKIILDYFNDNYFDLLIFAIENDAIPSVITFLISHYSSLNYSIYDETVKKYKSPLSCAILNYKFSTVQLLLDSGADINYDINGQDLLSKIYQEGRLTMSILTFILNHKFICITKPVSLFISRHQNTYLKEIFNYFFYDSVFISRVLSIYKHQQPLSTTQWNTLLFKEKTKVVMKFDWYYQALCYDNQEALSILLYYDDMGSFSGMSDYEICNLLDEAMEHSHFEFIKTCLSSTTVNFNSGLELFFSSRFLSKKKLKYRLKNILFIIEMVLCTNKSIDFHHINFVKVVVNLSQVLSDLNETEMKYLEMLRLFLKLSFNHPTFDVKQVRFENISNALLNCPATQNYPVLKCFIESLLECCQQFHFNDLHFDRHLFIFKQNQKKDGGGEDSNTHESYAWSLTSLFVKKALQHPTIDYKTFSLEKVLKILIQYDRGVDLIEEVIEKSMTHETFDYRVMNIKKVLMIIRQMDQPIPIQRLFILKLLSNPSFNLDSIDIGDILLPCLPMASKELLQFIIDIIFDHETFVFSHKISELLITATQIKEEFDPFFSTSFYHYLIEKAFLHKTVDWNSSTLEMILITLCKIDNSSFLDYILKFIFNITNTHRNHKVSCIDYKKIFSFLNRHDNPYMMEWLLTAVINEHNNNDRSSEALMNIYETILLSASNCNNYYSMTLVIQKLFNLSSLKSIQSIDLSQIQKIDPSFLILILNSLIKIHHLSLIHLFFEKMVNDLEPKVIINSKDNNGEYPIIVAASNVQFSGGILDEGLLIFDYLLKEGANTQVKNPQGVPLVMLVIRQKNYIILQRLVAQHHFSWDWIFEGDIKSDADSVTQEHCYDQSDPFSSLMNTRDANKFLSLLKENDKIISTFCFTPLILSYLLGQQEIFNSLIHREDINEWDGNGYTILHYAIIKEDIPTIQCLLDHKINIHSRKSKDYSDSIMDLVLLLKNKTIFSMLLKFDVTLLDNLNYRGEIPVISLLKSNHFSVKEKIDWMKYMLDQRYILFNSQHDGNNRKYKYEKLIVCDALKNSEIEIIHFLIQYDINFFSGMDDIWKNIIQTKRIEVLELFIPCHLDLFKRNSDDCTLLLLDAFKFGNMDLIRYLCENGMDIDVLDSLSIIKKVMEEGKEDLEIVRYILSRWITSAPLIDDNFQKSYQELLMAVIESGKEPMVQCLLDHCHDFGFCFDFSAFNIIEVIKRIIYRFENRLFQLLVPKYIDIHQNDSKGRNLFMMEAIQTRNQNLLKYLMEEAYQGLSFDPQSLENEQSLLGSLVRDNDIDIIKFLIQHEKGNQSEKEEKEGKENENPHHHHHHHYYYSYHYVLLEKAIDQEKMELIQYLVSSGSIHLNHTLTNGNTPLLYAIQQRSQSDINTTIIKYFVEYGANVDMINRQGDTPLITSIHNRKKEVVSYLLTHQVSIEKKNSYGNTPLIMAILDHQKDVVEQLLKMGADVNAKSKDQNSPLYYAMTTFILHENKNEDLDIIRTLIEHGADVHEKDQNGDLPIILAIKNGNQPLIKMLMEGGALSPSIHHGSKPSPDIKCLQVIASNDLVQIKTMNYAGVDITIAFLFAIEMGCLEVMNYFIEHRGASVNEREQWNRSIPIQAAIKSDHLDVVKALMERGAKVNWQLHFAIKRNQRDLILCLLEHGVNVNFQPNRCSPNPLIKACKRSNVHVVRDLVEHGADIHQLYFHLSRIDGDRTEMMPILIAIINRKISIANYLMDEGAHVNRGRGYYDKEPLKYAIDSGNLELVQWLVKHGANVTASSVQKAIELGDICMVDYLLNLVEEWEDSFYDTNKQYHYPTLSHDQYQEEKEEEEKLALYYQIKELLDKKIN